MAAARQVHITTTCTIGPHALLALGHAALALQPAEATHEGDHAEQHADAGAHEAPAPTVGLADITADQRCDEGAKVDAHVEDHEALVAARISWRIELADDVADVGFEEAATHHHQGEATFEAEFGRHHQHELASGHHDAADNHCPLCTEQAVRRPTTQDARRIDERGIGAVGEGRATFTRGKRRCDVERQQGAHPVVTEPLPHLGEEQHVEAGRMALAGHGSGVAQVGTPEGDERGEGRERLATPANRNTPESARKVSRLQVAKARTRPWQRPR
jgi:hypothetical protein